MVTLHGCIVELDSCRVTTKITYTHSNRYKSATWFNTCTWSSNGTMKLVRDELDIPMSNQELTDLGLIFRVKTAGKNDIVSALI